jgi:uncharacterized protein
VFERLRFLFVTIGPLGESVVSSRIDWESGRWTNDPIAATSTDAALEVEAREGSDAWVRTSYGFIHDSEHALLAPLPNPSAMEVTFLCEYDQQFDQAGLFIRVDSSHWIKAGVEFSDGQLQLGAVVTNGQSDWSLTPVKSWMGRSVTIRASRAGNAVSIRAGLTGERKTLVRLAPVDPTSETTAGPFCCAPTRSGLTVRFTDWTLDGPDASLH